MTRTLTAHAHMDPDGSWTVEIPELTSSTPSGATIVATGSATTFRGIRRAANDLASAWLDVEPDQVAVEITVAAPDEIVELVRASDKAEEEGNAARARGAQLRREAAHALREQGYPLEAAAAVIGVSYQRVQQLAS
ncbi:hypothetical protein ABC195_16505 [Microbacterium sp. 2P01SA-2]|uniref:hypothetical protein n=1 Tax=Microbacterium sp. 2P01SA-2 TaxID=3132290 RepID=UPI0039A398B3